MSGFKKFGKGHGKSGHSFPASFGFSGSAGQSSVRPHMRKPPTGKAAGGKITSLVSHPTRPRLSVRPAAPSSMRIKKTAFASGGLAHGSGCSCKMCSGGQMKAYAGGGLVGQHAPAPSGQEFAENPAWSDYKKGGRAKMKLRLKKGALHAAMGVPKGQKIPAKKLAAAKNSSSPLMRKRANFAINAKKWNHSR